MDADIIIDSRTPAPTIADLAVLAEAQGIRALWCASYLDSRDGFANLVPAAMATNSIKLGVIAVNPYDIHPVRIASAVLTLNEVSQGRAQVIIGGGGEALMALGIKPERRVGVVREAVEIVKAAGADAPLNYAGKNFTVKNYHPRWATAPKPPVYTAANKTQMLRMSARVADGIMLSDLPPPLAKQKIDSVKTQLAEFGRDAERFRFSNFLAWHIYPDKQKAEREARMWLGFRGLFRRWVLTGFMSDADYDIIEAHRDVIYQAAMDRTHIIPGVPEHLIQACVDQLTLTGDLGDLDRHIETLRQHKAVGHTEVAFELRDTPDQSIQIIGERVLPALREQR